MKLKGRRAFLSLLIAGIGFSSPGFALEIPPEVQSLHEDIWNRFVSSNGLVLDYTNTGGEVDMPTGADSLAGKPNAISWWTPTENGAFFTGLYLEGMVKRAALTHDPADKDKAKRLANGLLNCASVGNTPGFVARFVLADGTSHYGLGSDDQTGPWFSGLWSYVSSGIPTETEKKTIVDKMVEVATALKADRWMLPCDPVGEIQPGQYRGGFGGADYRGASRLLFVLKIMAELTKDESWRNAYQTALAEQPGGGTQTRLDIVAEGMPGDFRKVPMLSQQQFWIFINSQSMLHQLYLLEDDANIRSKYHDVLLTNAATVAPTARQGSPLADSQHIPFDANWRRLCDAWRPQATTNEATQLATEQFKLWRNEGRGIEIKRLREPLSAAWICFLAPERTEADKSASDALENIISGTSWKGIASSFGFLAEAAWYQMQDIPPAGP